MAKRTVPDELCGVRNILTFVSLPKSKIRDHVPTELSLTQVAMLKSVRPFTTPAGRLTYWLPPLRVTALLLKPATKMGPLTSVPVHPLPVESAAVVPLDSSNFR